jgi:outer membrane protein assembly factor BamA
MRLTPSRDPAAGDLADYNRSPTDGKHRSHRFIGNSSLFGTASLRVWLGRLPVPLLPTRFGVVGFVDTGRVWLVNESSDTWHTSLGGGLLAQPVMAPVTVHVIAANSKEGTRFYFGLGYPF